MYNTKIQILQKTIDEDPENPFAYFALAREFLKAQKRDQAREHYEHLIRYFPDYGGTYYHYAILLIEDNEMEAAVKIMDRGIEILRQTNEAHLLSELRALREQVLDE